MFLNFNLVPDIESPSLIVVTNYPNAATNEVKNIVTIPIERAVYSLKGVRSVDSISRQSFSIVKIRYKWGTNLNVAHIELREKLDLASSNFPREVARPTILNIQLSHRPVYAFIINAEDESINPASLYLFTKYDLSTELERMKGVSKAEVIGGSRPRINIIVDPKALVKYRLEARTVIDAVSSFGRNRPVGFLKKGNREYALRLQGEVKNYHNYEDIVVKNSKAGKVRVKDIGEVIYGTAERRRDILLGPNNVLAVYIYKQPGVNILLLSKSIRAKIRELSMRYDGMIQFEEIFDNSSWIKASLKELGIALLFGVLFTILAVWIWLRDIRISLLVILSIPASIIGTFILMKALGVSINILTLSGFSLAIGMIVDNAVIVVTSALRGYGSPRHNQPNLESGGKLDVSSESGVSYSGIKSAIPAVTSATLTTIVVFLPVIFLSGILRVFFMMLSLVMISSLLFSLLVSISLIPVILSDLKIKRRLHPIRFDIESLFNRMYEGLLRFVFKRRLFWTTVLLMISAFGIFSYRGIEKRLMDPYPQDFFYVKFFIDSEASIDYTERFIKKVAAKTGKIDGVKKLLTMIGEDPSDAYQNFSGLFGVNSGVMKIYVDKNGRDLYRIAADVRVALKDFNKDFDNVDFILSIPDNPVQKIISTSEYSSTVKIYGQSYESVMKSTNELYSYINSSALFDNALSSFYQRKSERLFSVKREYLPYYNITVHDLATYLKMAVSGVDVKSWKQGEYDIPVRVMMKKESIKNPSDILNLLIVNRGKNPVALSELINITGKRAGAIIFRENQRNYGWIGISDRLELSETENKKRIKSIFGLFSRKAPGSFGNVKSYCLKNRIEFKIEDQFTKFRENLRGLLIALFLSIFLEYIILVASFNSFTKPFIVIAMIPLSLGGVLLILLLTGSSLNINSFMSIIVLVGLLVNNAIMLFLEYGRRVVRDEKGVIQVSVYRLKPIMITTLSTILALTPGLFTSNRIQISLSITLILGLLYSTAVTLIFLPLFYRIFYMKD